MPGEKAAPAGVFVSGGRQPAFLKKDKRLASFDILAIFVRFISGLPNPATRGYCRKAPFGGFCVFGGALPVRAHDELLAQDGFYAKLYNSSLPQRRWLRRKTFAWTTYNSSFFTI